MRTVHFYDDVHGHWLGIVFDMDDMPPTIVVMGCEHSEDRIVKWLDAALESECWIEGNERPHDMYSRVSQTYLM